MDLKQRIQRLYAAVNQTVEEDLTKLPAKVAVRNKTFTVFQDFSGGKSRAQLENELQTIVALVAGLEYHLQRWASHNGKSTEYVSHTFRASRSLQIVHDLWNVEKHGYPMPHGRDRSKIAPRLVDISSVMRLSTLPKKGSWITMRMGKRGTPVTSGDGTARAVVTAEVVDRYGSKVGDVDELLSAAVHEIEKILFDFGLDQRLSHSK